MSELHQRGPQARRRAESEREGRERSQEGGRRGTPAPWAVAEELSHPPLRYDAASLVVIRKDPRQGEGPERPGYKVDASRPWVVYMDMGRRRPARTEPEDYECGVCHRVDRDSTFYTCVNYHLFCNYCGSRTMGRCPVCRSTIPLTRDRDAEWELTTLSDLESWPCNHFCGHRDNKRKIALHERLCLAREVRCPSHIVGCEWRGTAGALQNHLRRQLRPNESPCALPARLTTEGIRVISVYDRPQPLPSVLDPEFRDYTFRWVPFDLEVPQDKLQGVMVMVTRRPERGWMIHVAAPWEEEAPHVIKVDLCVTSHAGVREGSCYFASFPASPQEWTDDEVREGGRYLTMTDEQIRKLKCTSQISHLFDISVSVTVHWKFPHLQ